MSGLVTTINLVKHIYNNRPRGRRQAEANQSSDSVRGTPVIEGQRRANAIDSIVDHAVRGGNERQSSYPRK